LRTAALPTFHAAIGSRNLTGRTWFVSCHSQEHAMRVALVAFVLVLAHATAGAQQIAPSFSGSATQSAIGRTAIPEKIGKPLRRSLATSDVRLQNAAPLRLEHRGRPAKLKDIPTR
jgi:hypothetical protein